MVSHNMSRSVFYICRSNGCKFHLPTLSTPNYQLFNMSRRVVGNKTILIINACSIIIGCYGMYSNIMKTELPAHLAKGGHWQFLTNLSLVYSLVVFVVGFFAHLLKSNYLFHLKNTIHPIGLALETIVAGVYWPLRLFFLHLLLKDPSKFKLALSTDLCIHLMPVVSLLIDYLVFMPKWTIRNETALMLVIFLTTGYWALLKKLVDIESGAQYPYAFLDVGSEEKRALVFAVVGTVAFCQFIFMKRVYEWIVKETINVDEQIDKKMI